MRTLGWIGVLAGTLVLLGCGAEPAPTQELVCPAPEVQAPVAQPPAQAPAAASPQQLQGLLAGIRQAKQTVNGFTGEVKTYENGPKGTISETLEIAFKKPSTLRIEVTQSSGGNEGTKLLWSGGDDLKVKPSYLPFPVTLAMNDDHLLSKNGWEIRETEVNSILGVLLNPASRLTILGPQPYEGKMLIMVEVHSPATPKGGTREVIGIDPQTHLPGVRMIFSGEKLIYRLTIKRLTLHTPSSDDLEI